MRGLSSSTLACSISTCAITRCNFPRTAVKMRNVLAAVRLPPGHRAGAPTLFAACLRVWPAHQASGALWQVRQASGVEGDVRPSDWFMVKIGSALSMGQVRNSLHSTRGPPAAGRPALAPLCGAAQWIPVSLAQLPLWSTAARAQVLIWSVRAPFRTRGMMTGRLPQRFRLRSSANLADLSVTF